MATTNKAGRDPVKAAALTPVVVYTPGAAPEQVQQHSRRGRHPKGVVSLSRIRQARGSLARVARPRAQLDLIRAARRETYEAFKLWADESEALKKRGDALGAVSTDLDSRDKALCAELSAIGAPAPSYLVYLGLAE